MKIGRCNNWLKFGVLFFAFLPAAQAGDAPFSVQTVKAEHSIRALKAVNFFAAKTPAIMARGDGADGAHLFSFYKVAGGSVTPEPALQVEMPESGLFFDFAPLMRAEQDSLLVFDNVGVMVYDVASKAFKRLVTSPSIYRHSGTPVFEAVDFARDFSGDGLADILIPDFEGYHLFVNDGTGLFKSEIWLDMPVELRMNRAEDQYVTFPPYSATPRYTQFPALSADANFDGLTDIVFLKDNSFVAFHQKVGGGFDSAGVVYPIDIKIIGNSFAEQLKSVERYADQRSLTETIITAVTDINADGVLDIVTETDSAEGLFNRTTGFSFHYGFETKGMLAFRPEADSTIKLEGFAAGTRYEDFTGDGRPDFATGAVDIGLGKIISILLSGSAGVHVHFFAQHPDGTFSEKADYRKKISVAVDLSSGQSTIPVVELADITGDGFRDLLLSKKQTELQLYSNMPDDDDLFDRSDKKMDITLPKNNKFVTAADINADGKADILIHYDRLGADGADMKNTFLVLLAH
ncbi:FG-GAP repeat domain-containing protein [Kordiimonas pumila]|uniref:FG-GAP repeat domain-containing protein n=1 Tax=Kordiimonas pumila TaxID=2161677 RepID=A0ABV7D5X4_9PROT|nr:VCBS repeat-containing protein [Kordiimonas pumila]